MNVYHLVTRPMTMRYYDTGDALVGSRRSNIPHDKMVFWQTVNDLYFPGRFPDGTLTRHLPNQSRGTKYTPKDGSSRQHVPPKSAGIKSYLDTLRSSFLLNGFPIKGRGETINPPLARMLSFMHRLENNRNPTCGRDSAIRGIFGFGAFSGA